MFPFALAEGIFSIPRLRISRYILHYHRIEYIDLGGGDCMNKRGIRKLYLGFIFIMLSFRIQGFDVLPDTLGYLLFASGFNDLVLHSPHFSKAAKYNISMLILSLFSIYQSPVISGDIQFSPFGIFGIPISIATFVLNLLVVYNLFMGIKDMAENGGQSGIAVESNKIWNQYKLLQIAIVSSFVIIFIPLLALVYIIVVFVITIKLVITIVGFLKRCSEYLG